jgi:hypothetical protein
MRTRPSTFGPGKYRVSLTKLFRGSLEEQVNITLYSEVIAQNPEFLRVKNDFKYVKFEGVAVTFEPRNLPTSANQTPAFMIMNYDGTTTKNIRLQDSAKIIPAYLTKSRMFKFNVPKMNSYAGIINGWFNMGDVGYISDIMLQIHAPNNTTEWFFKIDVIMLFRGPTNENDQEPELQETKLDDVRKRWKEKLKVGNLNKKSQFAESKSENAKIKILSDQRPLTDQDKKQVSEAGVSENAESGYEDDDWGDL